MSRYSLVQGREDDRGIEIYPVITEQFGEWLQSLGSEERGKTLCEDFRARSSVMDRMVSLSEFILGLTRKVII